MNFNLGEYLNSRMYENIVTLAISLESNKLQDKLKSQRMEMIHERQKKEFEELRNLVMRDLQSEKEAYGNV